MQLEPEAISPSATIGKRAVHTQLLVQAMRQVAEGQTFTYAQAEAITSLPKAKLMHYLYSAIDILLKDYGLNFQCDRTVGYTHIPAEKVPAVANKKQIKKIRNTARRYRDELEAVDPFALPDQARIEHTLGMTNVSLVEAVASSKSQRALRKQTQNMIGDPVQSLDKAALVATLSRIWA